MTHRPWRLETRELRGLRCQLRHWGREGAPRVFLLHGWMDTSATFQFVVDALQGDWHVIAPDWRGYGGSSFLRRPYWFPEYYADLDILLDQCSPDEPARLVGHSMSASIASMYAAVRPERVRALAMLDFLGLKTAPAEDAPERIGDWIAAVNGEDQRHRLRRYPNVEALARRLRLFNTRLSAERADFLARHTAIFFDGGEVELACDPWHKIASPMPYRVEEVMACWRKIVAPTLLLFAEAGFVKDRFGDDPPELARRLACFQHSTLRWIDDAGHNLHHDQPARVAAEIEAFLAAVV